MISNDNEHMIRYVLCSYEQYKFRIPVKTFLAMRLLSNFHGRKLIRGAEGASVYNRSIRAIFELAREADAVYKVGKMVLINPYILTDYILSEESSYNLLEEMREESEKSIRVDELRQALSTLPDDYEVFVDLSDPESNTDCKAIDGYEIYHEYGEIRLKNRRTT